MVIENNDVVSYYTTYALAIYQCKRDDSADDHLHDHDTGTIMQRFSGDFFAIVAPASWILAKQNVLRGASGHSKSTGSPLDAILLLL